MVSTVKKFKIAVVSWHGLQDRLSFSGIKCSRRNPIYGIVGRQLSLI